MSARSTPRLSLLSLAILTGLVACHPLACCAPGDLPRDKPLEVVSSSSDAPDDRVDVVLDELGVPHIFGKSEPDLAYGLGWMHGRDRQFQVYAYVHAGEGRLTELLGEDLLEIDRQNRLLTHRLDEQLEALSDRDRAIIEAYCDGINDGARMVGRSAEMHVLGVDWEPLSPRDVLAVMRLQQWSQSVGFSEEMARWRLAKALGGVDDPRFAELTADTPSNGHPIVDADAHSGAAFGFGTDRPRPTFHQAPSSSDASSSSAQPASASLAATKKKKLVGGVLRGVKLDVGHRYGRGGTGASNEWVVDGAHNSSGVPVLVNDPHLGHSAPGVFYMVHLEGPDSTIVGGSFPGIPGVLIGHGRHIAWGITNAYADVQDVVVLRPWAGNPDLYELDGAPVNFTRETQRFKMGKDVSSTVVEETYLKSIFGPVLPPGYGSYDGAESQVDDDERLALQWTAFAFPERTGGLIGSFWDLARASTIEEAHAAAQAFTSPSMSIAIAISDNADGQVLGRGASIHYRLGGIIPIRGDDQRVDFPRSGASRAAGFVGVLDPAQKPQLDDPARGWLVASNQRVVENGSLSQRFVGYEGARHFRASRIHERLDALFAEDELPTPEQLLSIQQDVESIEARTLAPILGKHCPDEVDGFDDDVVGRFCDAVADFDGVYDTDAKAIPFARLYRALQERVLQPHMSDDLMLEIADHSWAQMAIFDLIQRADAGEDVALFDLDDAVAAAAEDALWIVRDETGLNDDDWRWGKLHTLTFRGVLASAPVIGGLFQTGAHEESGTGSAPRAESSDFFQKLRVQSGAGLRHIAVMSEPPVVKMVNDTGQSGHFGHRHLEDQYPLWTRGEPRLLWRDQDDVEKTNDGLAALLPKE